MIENGIVSPEQAQEAMKSLQAVNLDEVVNEVIAVKVRYYKEQAVLDDEGQPFCDEEGQPLKYRRAGTRTAYIQNIVPVDIYAQSIAIANGFQGGIPGSEQINAMGDIVLKIWQISEPFMTHKMLIEEGIDGEVVMSLFMRFFDKVIRPQSA